MGQISLRVYGQRVYAVRGTNAVGVLAVPPPILFTSGTGVESTFRTVEEWLTMAESKLI